MTASPPAVLAAELSAFLRLDGACEDGLLAGFAAAATQQAEAFLGQLLIERETEATFAMPLGSLRLSTPPVRAVLAVETLAEAGAATPLTGWSWDLDGAGCAHVWSAAGWPDTTLRVRYRAGWAADINGLPEPVRLAVLRLAAGHHANRDGAGAAFPDAVAALLRPWRRLKL